MNGCFSASIAVILVKGSRSRHLCSRSYADWGTSPHTAMVPWTWPALLPWQPLWTLSFEHCWAIVVGVPLGLVGVSSSSLSLLLQVMRRSSVQEPGLAASGDLMSTWFTGECLVSQQSWLTREARKDWHRVLRLHAGISGDVVSSFPAMRGASSDNDTLSQVTP